MYIIFIFILVLFYSYYSSVLAFSSAYSSNRN